MVREARGAAIAVWRERGARLSPRGPAHPSHPSVLRREGVKRSNRQVVASSSRCVDYARVRGVGGLDPLSLTAGSEEVPHAERPC
jgi:hypothetical protein